MASDPIQSARFQRNPSRCTGGRLGLNALFRLALTSFQTSERTAACVVNLVLVTQEFSSIDVRARSSGFASL